MLNRFVQFSLRFRGVVLTLACLVLFYGVFVFLHARLDVFPDFVPPQITIQTEAPGFSPDQVELLITTPIEAALGGVPGTKSVRSESIQGLSIIRIDFLDDTEILSARSLLAERLTDASTRLPAGTRPRMTPMTSSTMDLLKIGLLSTNRTPMELRALADWVIKPRLLAVPGVAKCSVFGGDARQIVVDLRPASLRASQVSAQEIIAAIRAAITPIAGGFIETPNQRLIIQPEHETAMHLSELLIPLAAGGKVRLGDLAQVRDGIEPKFGDTVIQGKPGVLLTLATQYGANTMEATRSLEKALLELKPILAAQQVELLDQLHRPATFIEGALANIKHSLFIGGVLVAVVLFLFLFSFRTALISLVAIPLSLFLSVIGLNHFGFTLNTITLGGLAIAIGEVVDDAIIDVENIVRRLRLSLPGIPIHQVILKASLEVRTAVVYATFVVVLVFTPVLALTGLQGRFFAPLALSYILAILASLLVALTVTPALAATLFRNGVKDAREPKLQTFLRSAYHRVLGRIARTPRLMMVVVAVLCLLALLPLPQLGGEFLPEFREGHFVLQVSAMPGTSLPEMKRIGIQICEALLTNNAIATIEQQIGRAEQGEDPWGPNRSEFHVELKREETKDQGKVATEIRAVLKSFPGLQSEVLTFLGDRIGETITGETAPIVINVFGDDLDLLDAKASEIAALVKQVPGATDVQVKSPPGEPRLAVRLRPERLSLYGFQPSDVWSAIQLAKQGVVAGQRYEGNRVFDVVVRTGGEGQDDELSNILVESSTGTRLPLSELADTYLTSGRASILREAARRRQVVTCGMEGRSVDEVTEGVRKAIRTNVQFPAGTYAVVSGAAAARTGAQRQLIINSAVAAVGVLILLSIAFHKLRHVALILANIPFALAGGILALYLTHLVEPDSGHLSIGALVGFVTLFGITMRNSMMLVSHFEYLVREEGLAWNAETALRGASERLVPILMTALVTGLGLLPLALGAGDAGREIEGPMAIVILGGLVTSTALNLLVLPTLALRFGRFDLGKN